MLLEIKNLEKKFPIKDGILQRTRHWIHAVNNVSFQLDEKKTLGLVGESGSGKSTLGRLIMQLLEPTSGEVFFQDQKLTGLSFKEMLSVRSAMQMIFQDPADSLNSRMTIEQIVTEPLDINQVGTRKERSKKVDELLDIVGVGHTTKTRFPHEFSGGQRQRIGIARALTLSPKLIIADEPVSALDVSIQAQILNLLQELQEQFEIGYLFIAHDIHVIRFISHQIAVMYMGQIVEFGDTEEISKNPLHPYTQGLFASVPIPDPKNRNQFHVIEGEVPSMINPPSGCFFHPRCPQAMESCQTRSPSMKMIDQASQHQVSCFLYDQ
ncbi:MAG: ABC transporter ATP-binding protein [Proteobacteria bacterium]|nr:ABC transporter ATP-binding protein [Pseudomonadota bacterium]